MEKIHSPYIRHSHLATESTPSRPMTMKKTKNLTEEILMSVKEHFKYSRIGYETSRNNDRESLLKKWSMIIMTIIFSTNEKSHSVKGLEFMNVTYSAQADMSTQAKSENDVNHFQQPVSSYLGNFSV